MRGKKKKQLFSVWPFLGSSVVAVSLKQLLNSISIFTNEKIINFLCKLFFLQGGVLSFPSTSDCKMMSDIIQKKEVTKLLFKVILWKAGFICTIFSCIEC